MNTTELMDEMTSTRIDNPGAQLAQIREKRGYSREYIAGKLHLRVRIIELLETDNYEQMPEPVFVKGYLRAYAKLLGIHPEPYLDSFNNSFVIERKTEKALWQSKRESHGKEKMIRWVTGLLVICTIIAISVWWQNSKESEKLFFTHTEKQENRTAVKEIAPTVQPQKLDHVSRLRSMFKSNSQDVISESKSG